MAKVRIRLDPAHALIGYTLRDPPDVRRRALVAAVSKRGFVKVIRRLNVLYVYNKYRHPDTARAFREDMQWIQKLRAQCLLNAIRPPSGKKCA